MTRALKPDFYNEFKNGCFKNLIELINNTGIYKSRFMLNLRGNQVIVYYKGAVVVRIYDKTKNLNSYRFEVQTKYETGKSSGYSKFEKSAQELSKFSWKQFLTNIADGIDSYDKKDNSEKEVQQRIWYENNVARNANSTEYVIVDTEYAVPKNGGRFDLIAFYWPNHKKKPEKISVLELKFGDSAIGGKSVKQTATLTSHLHDFMKFEFDESFLKDITKMFFQLYDLGLINMTLGANIKKHAFDNDYNLIDASCKKQMMFILGNYNQDSGNLNAQQTEMKKQTLPIDRDVVFATSSFMGYGLYNVGMKHSL